MTARLDVGAYVVLGLGVPVSEGLRTSCAASCGSRAIYATSGELVCPVASWRA